MDEYMERLIAEEEREPADDFPERIGTSSKARRDSGPCHETASCGWSTGTRSSPGSTPWAHALALGIPSADHDECVFPNPGSSTWTAARTGNVGLGRGTHLCAGAALARWEVETDEKRGTQPGRTLTDRLGPRHTCTLPQHERH